MAGLDTLKPDKRNARRHTPRNVGMIEHSIQANGFGRSVLLANDGTIIAGNATIDAAASAGLDDVLIVETDGTKVIAVKRTDIDPDSPQFKALALSDNRAAELAEWEPAVIAQLNDEMDLSPYFYEDELTDLLATMAGEVEGLTDPDAVPEPPTEPTTKPGDLWRLGRHRLLCGDSTVVTDVERLMGGTRANITFTSPPYNAAKNSHLNGRVQGFDNKYETHDDAMDDADYLTLLVDSTTTALTVSDYVFVNLQLLAHNRRVLTEYQYHFREWLKDILIWNKRQCPPNIVKGAFNTKWEYLYCFSQNNATRGFPADWQGAYPNVIETESNSSNDYADDHRAGFPVALPMWLLEKFPFAQTVYEPFTGTGTTIVACEQTGRTCYGMEISPAYCDVILARWSDFTGLHAELIRAE